MYISTLKNISELFRQYVERNAVFCKDHPSAKVSQFWADIFNDRPNFPELNDLLVFRRSNATWGSGDTKHADDKTKLREYRETLATIRLFVPDYFLKAIHEPVLGAPVVFTEDGITLSANFAMNAGTAWQTKEVIASFFPSNRTLNICEIGAGFGGCAYQLHQILSIMSYTIVDLPENLCLSSAFLGATLQSKMMRFIECAPEAVSTKVDNGLYFSLPPGIDNLEGKFDVMLNSFSFHEMDRDAVESYLKLASRALSDDGILISFNSHDKAGITKASQYCIDGLSLISLKTFRKVPTGFFNTIAYEMVLAKSRAGQIGCAHEVIDPLCEMMQLGLDGDLTEIIQRMLDGQLSLTDLEYLSLIRNFFYAPDEKIREGYLEILSKDSTSPIPLFLSGNYKLLRDDLAGAQKDLSASCELGLKDFARVRAKTALGIIYTHTGKWLEPKEVLLEDLRQISGGLFHEIKTLIDNGSLVAMQAHIGHVMNDFSDNRFSSSLPRKIKRLGLKGILRRLLARS